MVRLIGIIILIIVLNCGASQLTMPLAEEPTKELTEDEIFAIALEEVKKNALKVEEMRKKGKKIDKSKLEWTFE